MLLFIDNFDSFTYNLVHLIKGFEVEVVVARNDALDLNTCIAMNPSFLVVGPGPGTPADAGISKSLIQHFEGSIPILGVCLGHQAIAEVYGGKVLPSIGGPCHGKTTPILHNNQGIFDDLPQQFTATRYHSLSVDKETLPSALQTTAWMPNGEIMGIRHLMHPTEGVQFHPESILTDAGQQLFSNFLTQRKLVC